MTNSKNVLRSKELIKLLEAKKLTPNQSKYFFLLKGLLIFTVVMGHLGEFFSNNPTIFVIVGFIYTFHMPLFAFTTGVFSKFSVSKILGALTLYFIFSTLRIFTNYIANVLILKTSFDLSATAIIQKFAYPQWTFWYLPAYCVWVLSCSVIKRVNLLQVLIAFAIPLFLGYFKFINSFLTLSRIFYFFPFFLLGKYARQNKDKFFELLSKLQNLKGKIISVLGTALAITVICLVRKYVTKSWLYGKEPYSSDFDCLLRILAYALTLITSTALLVFLPYKPNGKFKCKALNFLEKLGSFVGKNTLSVYLLHSSLIAVFDHLTHGYLATRPIFLALALITIPLILCLILSLKWIAFPINFINNLFKKKSK